MSQVSFKGDAREVSKYIKRFEKLAETSFLELKGNLLIIERLPKVDMTTKSGIIIPSSIKGYRDTHADMVTDFGLVLMTGPGEVLEDGTHAAMETQVGDVILLPNNVHWYSTFGALADYEANTIGVTRDSHVLMTFKDYIKTFEVLNG